jgi:hypothetical protein
MTNRKDKRRPKEAERGAKGLTVKVAQTKEKLLSVRFSQSAFRASRFFIEGKLYDSKPLQVTINLRILDVKPQILCFAYNQMVRKQRLTPSISRLFRSKASSPKMSL